MKSFSITKGLPLPRLNIARQAAAFRAIQLLFEAGELDDHLKPYSRKEAPNSDTEDNDKMEAKKRRHAGTSRRVMYHRNKVMIHII